MRTIFSFKTKHYDVRLDSNIANFTGGISAHPPAGANLSPELSLQALVALAKPAAIQLQGLQKSGNGFFITETGVIATNAHLTRDEGLLITILPDGQDLEGKVVYIDEDLDIALVQSSRREFSPPLVRRCQTVRQGESVFAIGNPSGAMHFSMTKGIVSAVGKFQPDLQRRIPCGSIKNGSRARSLHRREGPYSSLNSL
jgi:S1-C subfamily serine protease